MDRFVTYYRVSTERQGRSGLGLEAQQADAGRLMSSRVGSLELAHYTEIETGKTSDRPELAKAIAHARACNAILLVAKLDRLARNVAFTSALMDSGLEFICCDCPQASRLTLHILAAVAEEEARAISERTTKALAALKARGVRLGSARVGAWVWKDGVKVWREAAWVGKEHLRGFKAATARSAEMRRRGTDAKYAHLIPVLKEMRAAGKMLVEIAEWLNANGHCTPTNKSYTAVSVWRLFKRHTSECQVRLQRV